MLPAAEDQMRHPAVVEDEERIARRPITRIGLPVLAKILAKQVELANGAPSANPEATATSSFVVLRPSSTIHRPSVHEPVAGRARHGGR